MKTTIHFVECEHDGDYQDYANDLGDSGAKIINHELNYEAETCDIFVEIEDIGAFIEKFKKTDSIGFSSYHQYEEVINEE